MVDLDKFICSMIWHSTSDGLIRQCLKDQGLEYKDGKLVRIQEKRTPVTIESPYGKETFYMTDEQKDLFESSCKKPSTIKFNEESAEKKRYFLELDDYSDELRSKVKGLLTVNEPDIDAMVEEYKKKTFETFDKAHSYYLAATYRQGLEDMWKRLKG